MARGHPTSSGQAEAFRLFKAAVASLPAVKHEAMQQDFPASRTAWGMHWRVARCTAESTSSRCDKAIAALRLHPARASPAGFAAARSPSQLPQRRHCVGSQRHVLASGMRPAVRRARRPINRPLAAGRGVSLRRGRARVGGTGFATRSHGFVFFRRVVRAHQGSRQHAVRRLFAPLVESLSPGKPRWSDAMGVRGHVRMSRSRHRECPSKRATRSCPRAPDSLSARANTLARKRWSAGTPSVRPRQHGDLGQCVGASSRFASAAAMSAGASFGNCGAGAGVRFLRRRLLRSGRHQDRPALLPEDRGRHADAGQHDRRRHPRFPALERARDSRAVPPQSPSLHAGSRASAPRRRRHGGLARTDELHDGSTGPAIVTAILTNPAHGPTPFAVSDRFNFSHA
jgi:hypothetical protein